MVQGPGGIFHLGGHIVDGSVELLHHPFYLVGGADHALALGAFGSGLSRAGLGHGLLGLCSFPAGRLSLRSGLSHQFAQICLHAAQRIGQQAHIVAAVHVQVQIALTLGHVLGITGNLGHRRTYHPPQHDRNGQLQHQQGTAHHDGLLDGGFFQTAQHVNGHAHKPHAHSLAVGGLDRPVGGIVRHAQNGVVGIDGFAPLQHGLDNVFGFQPGADDALAVPHNGGHDAGIAFKNGHMRAGDLAEPVHIGRPHQRNADGNAAHQTAFVHDRLAGPDSEGHYSARNYGHGRLTLKGFSHGFLFEHAVAVFGGMAAGHHHSLGVGDGHKVRFGLLHGGLAQAVGRFMIFFRNGAGQAVLVGHERGALGKTLSRALVGHVHHLAHALDALVEFVLNGRFHEIDRNKQHHAATGDQRAE